MLGVGGRRRRDDDGVTLGEHLVERRGGIEPVDVGIAVAGAHRAPQSQHAAAEGPGADGDGTADMAQAHNADRRAREGSAVAAFEFVAALELVRLP